MSFHRFPVAFPEDVQCPAVALQRFRLRPRDTPLRLAVDRQVRDPRAQGGERGGRRGDAWRPRGKDGMGGDTHGLVMMEAGHRDLQGDQQFMGPPMCEGRGMDPRDDLIAAFISFSVAAFVHGYHHCQVLFFSEPMIITIYNNGMQWMILLIICITIVIHTYFETIVV